MSRQQELQTLFESILGNRNVYFQPPETVKLKYPCIIYSRDIIRNLNANDKPYKINEGFSVTYIDKDPVSEIPMNSKQQVANNVFFIMYVFFIIMYKGILKYIFITLQNVYFLQYTLILDVLQVKLSLNRLLFSLILW